MTNNNDNNSKIIALTMGDPSGISPDIILKSFAETKAFNSRHVIVLGCVQTLKRVEKLLNIKSLEMNIIQDPQEAIFNEHTLNIIDVPVENAESLLPGKVQAIAGDCAYRCIKKAVDLYYEGKIHALATAPLNKEALHLAGHMYPGHTELLAHLTNTKDVAMLLYSKALRVIHVSTHVSMREFLDTLNQARIIKVTELANEFMKKVGIEKPSIAIAGVNPHAGEDGIFGTEEIEILKPAIKKLQNNGIDVFGPCPPDTVFLESTQGKGDIVVAMYHDQGHIPLKALDFHGGVNISAGLPFIRTSVDHGTAFNIAWQGKALYTSLEMSVNLAFDLIK